MKELNITSLQEELGQLSTQELDEILQAELKKDPIDDVRVRSILKILEKRENDWPISIDSEAAAAWEKYISPAVSQPEEQTSRWSPPRKWALKVASVVLVLGIFVPPLTQEVHAKAVLEMFVRWTDCFLEVFTPEATHDNKVEYVFKTDHPGLQQVHEAVTEMGITDPVVPTWLPDGYELVEIKEENTTRKRIIFTVFKNQSTEMVLMIEIANNDTLSMLHKNMEDVDIYEKDGTIHNIILNRKKCTAIWTRSNIGCVLITECQKDVVCRIIDSIYLTEAAV